MTIEKLLGYTTKELQALSDDDLLKIFQPYLKVTRVEEVKNIKKKAAGTKDEILKAKEKANELAKAMGLGKLF